MSEYDEALIVMEFEETRGFVCDAEGVRQVFGPPVPPSPPRPKLLCNKCGSGNLCVSLVAYFGPDRNSWGCADCKAHGKVYEIDGTPEAEWPVPVVPVPPDATYKTEHGTLNIWKNSIG